MSDDISVADAIGLFRPAPAKKLIEDIQAYAFQDPAWLYDVTPIDQHRDVWQGDLIPDAAVSYLMDSGQAAILDGPVLLLSASCDAVVDRDAVVTVAPTLTLSEHVGAYAAPERRSRERAIRENRKTSLLFLPGFRGWPDTIAEFSLAGPVSTAWLDRIARAGDQTRRLRLSVNGWYMLVLKLALHHSRSESIGDPPRV
jgi:hypothetical protein